MKLTASTIIESITAMVIIGIVFTIGMMTFGKMLDINPAPQKIRIKIAFENIVQETKTQELFLDDRIEGKGFNILKTIKPYRDYDNIYQLSLIAVDDQEKELAQLNELIYTIP